MNITRLATRILIVMMCVIALAVGIVPAPAAAIDAEPLAIFGITGPGGVVGFFLIPMVAVYLYARLTGTLCQSRETPGCNPSSKTAGGATPTARPRPGNPGPGPEGV